MTLALVVIAWTALAACVATWALLISRGPAATRPGAATGGPALVVLRPCCGREPHLGEALRSTREVERDAIVRFLVGGEDDEAYAVCAEVARELTADGRDAGVIVTHAGGPNRKADQLARGLATVGAERPVRAVLVADSDVEMTRDAASAAFEPVLSGAADACWAPPVEPRARTAADRASSAILDGSLHAFSLLAALDSGTMVGKLFAVRTSALADIGGFEGLVRHLGEDMELARRLRSNGFVVRVARATATSLASGRSWPAVVTRYTRWLSVIRAQRPALLASYPLLLAAAPLQLALALVAAAVDGVSGALAVASVCVVRSFVALAARARSGRPLAAALSFSPWLADFALLAAFVRVLGSRTVSWRGGRLSVGPGGMLVEHGS